ncbi:DUF4157 domain-containing protein [Lysobacter sp. CFH 32150]|uniref:eCIS core domain-containing protein n=1 Tax=Lysobacter sp. CFH 32150 TaxID=2927128 RepID=UPI001FA7B90A|nr:DUF4157 domain-containing protein [Lysobacter sp. CFH 32150]MCI4567343.1 DUF4157 domain-containing protein [Lysobacter sp. CFH 32150]
MTNSSAPALKSNASQLKAARGPQQERRPLSSSLERAPVPAGKARPLATGIAAEMGQRLGQDFSGVRVHEGTEAQASAEALQARAYTYGEHIVLGRNAPPPDTFEGKRTLAHELAHVVQQRRGGPPPALSSQAPHEAAAERAASAVMSGSQSVSVSGATGVGVARDEDNKRKRKPQWAKGLSPDQKRDLERKKEVLDEFKERAHDDKAALDEERTRNRSGASEQARHRDRSKDIDLHHGFPKFIGGNRIQTYIKLTKELHYLYHEELYLLLEKELKALGKLPKEAGRASRKHYGRMVKSLSPQQQKDLQAKILKHAKEFDDRYRKTEYPDKRQRLEAAVRRGIREADKENATKGKQAQAGKSAAKTPAKSGKPPAKSPAGAPAKPAAPSKAAPAAKQKSAPAKPAAKRGAKPTAQAPAKPPAKSSAKPAAKAPAQSAPAKAPAKASPPPAKPPAKSAAKAPAKAPAQTAPAKAPAKASPSPSPAKPAAKAPVQPAPAKAPVKASPPPSTPAPAPAKPSATTAPKPAPNAPTGAAKPAAPAAVAPQKPPAPPPAAAKAAPSQPQKAPPPTTAGTRVADTNVPSAPQPSAGAAKMQAAAGGLQLAGQGLAALGNYVQGKAAEEAYQRMLPAIQALQNSTDEGVWVHFVYSAQDPHPDSAINPVPVFSHIETQIGTRDNKRTPAGLTAGGSSTRVNSTWLPPGQRSLKTELNDLFRRLKVMQTWGERETKRTFVGRFLLERKGDSIDIGLIYEARAHLVSARIALEQKRPLAAEESMKAADALLDQMMERIEAYTGQKF